MDRDGRYFWQVADAGARGGAPAAGPKAASSANLTELGAELGAPGPPKPSLEADLGI